MRRLAAVALAAAVFILLVASPTRGEQGSRPD